MCIRQLCGTLQLKWECKLWVHGYLKEVDNHIFLREQLLVSGVIAGASIKTAPACLTVILVPNTFMADKGVDSYKLQVTGCLTPLFATCTPLPQRNDAKAHAWFAPTIQAEVSYIAAQDNLPQGSFSWRLIRPAQSGPLLRSLETARGTNQVEVATTVLELRYCLVLAIQARSQSDLLRDRSYKYCAGEPSKLTVRHRTTILHLAHPVTSCRLLQHI